jgi:sn-glycerol 3-phosphate transport system permease protein
MNIEGDLLREPTGEASRPLPRSAVRAVAGTSRQANAGVSERWATHVNGWLLLLPAAVLLVTFTHYPAVATFIGSFFSTPKGTRPAVFVGLDNYQAMIEDPIFWQALHNNIIYAVSTIPLTIVLALFMAVTVNAKMVGRSFMRLAFFTPTVLPMIAVANIWLFFYSPGYGLADQVLGLFGLPAHNWLGDEQTALVCLIVVAVWKDAGFFMIFYLAALQQMPPNLSEAAALEGASRWYFFRRVTFPLLMPTTLFVLINAIINSFRLVDHIVVMTRGGPNNTTALLLYYIYEVGFKFWDTAFAATLTVVLLVLLAAMALGQFIFLDRRIHYQ